MHTQAVPQRRILTILVIAQILSGAGLAAGITVGALLAQDVLESTSLAGVPAALFTVGAALSAVAVGRISQRRGRRVGLSVGYATGAVGSAGVVIAATIASTPLLFGALLIYGAGMATNLQARYAGADLATPERRGTAISIVLVATTVGAVIGPNTVTLTGDLAQFFSIPPLAGPFLLATVAYGVAALVLWIWLRPDPLLLARTLPVEDEPPSGAAASVSWRGMVILGAAVMAVTQAVMIAIMTMTPIHMQHHGHSLGATGVVIGLHVAAMYLPSPISGVLVDRYGTRPIAALAAVTLVGAGIAAALSTSVVGLVVALMLLGLGWNLGLVSGTTMITAYSPLESRARIQGNVDLSITLAGAGGGFASGAVVAATSYTLLSVAGGILAMLVIPMLIFTKARNRSIPTSTRRV
ncbi:MFS transporter [Hoyosella rhizosphaerae]|uniref:MFS-type transporter YdeG n=1 Tax=Hoyosella rhizosphaerae TaxID=1755582 RepID=A0A916U1D4_9ACTN|nr:MFS transporter [Hoyosella rhizosphaerae]GGC54333.1 putative MFS-type transporter YdeG [Hoyosella rhizosphaerae]